MNTPDDFSQYYSELLVGTYDCVDRIALNNFFSDGTDRRWHAQLVAAAPRR